MTGRVTCFGNKIVMICFSFQPGSWPTHDTCLPQSLVITNFNWMNASGNQRCIASPFVISLLSLSHSHVLILPFCISSLRLSRHDPILTEHQAFAPSGPMLLLYKNRYVELEFCFRASARAWQETNDLI